MINKVRGISNLSFKAHFVDDENGNLNFLYNKSRGILNRNELDTFSKTLPDHAIEIQNICQILYAIFFIVYGMAFVMPYTMI